ncbi:hypothetical protein Tco_0503180 [Tanacetum coccineum]
METKDTLSSCSNSEEQQMQQIQDKAKENHGIFDNFIQHLKALINNDLKEPNLMFLNVDQLEKQLDKEEFQEIGSMAAFKRGNKSSRSGNDAHADDADIRPIYDEEPMVEKCVFNANHDSCVTKFLNEVNSRAKVPSNKTTKRYIPVEQTSFAKKPEDIPKDTGKLFKTVGLKWIPFGKIFTSSTTKVDSDPINGTSVANDTSGLVPQRQKVSDYDNPDPTPELQNVSPSADTTIPSQQELDLLFVLSIYEFFNDGTSRVNKSSSPTDDSAQQDTLPSTNIHPTTEPSTPTHVNAEENNNDQAEFTNPFCTPVQEIAESSLRNIAGSQKARRYCNSSGKAEYVALSASSAQVMLMRSYALSWKPCQGDSLNLPDHRIHKDGDASRFKNHESSRIKDKDFRTNSDIQDLPSKISSLSREIVSKLSVRRVLLLIEDGFGIY